MNYYRPRIFRLRDNRDAFANSIERVGTQRPIQRSYILAGRAVFQKELDVCRCRSRQAGKARRSLKDSRHDSGNVRRGHARSAHARCAAAHLQRKNSHRTEIAEGALPRDVLLLFARTRNGDVQTI